MNAEWMNNPITQTLIVHMITVFPHHISPLRKHCTSDRIICQGNGLGACASVCASVRERARVCINAPRSSGSLRGISGRGRGEGRQYGGRLSRITNSSPRNAERIVTELHCTCCNSLPHGTHILLNVQRVSQHGALTMSVLFTIFPFKCHYFSREAGILTLAPAQSVRMLLRVNCQHF